MNERDWLLPSIALTLLSGAFALLMMPDYSGVMPALSLLPMWMVIAAVLAALCGLSGLVRMARAGVKSPTAHIARLLVERRSAVALVVFGTALAGLNMVTFMWTKPLLNYLVPFWADPLLADLDYVLFAGRDPWTLLGWLNSMPMAIFYHRGWFALMVLTLLLVLSRPPSPEKSAVMLSYFLLWSVAGPVIHTLLPAGGPIFYDDLGYGSRFSGILLPEEVVRTANYLWSVYGGEQFAPGAGISAMPSLHIATTVWMVLATYVLARRWFAAMSAAGLLIFLLSISLGWHYAVDGIVGGGAALLCYAGTRRLFERSAGQLQTRPALAGADR